MGSTEEPERKRRHNNSISPMLKKQPLLPSSEEKKVDAAVLQYQNQKLAQQLDAQKNEIHALEGKFNQLKSKQTAYDDILITVNSAWNQLVEDLGLLAIRASGKTTGVQVLDNPRPSKVLLHVIQKKHFCIAFWRQVQLKTVEQMILLIMLNKLLIYGMLQP